ncbi:MAG TPA: hypothetical protein VML94_08220 [Thermoplasmata archaeon]|nr:hypothetical protein [Thermoplasmata archaeon]
MISMPKSWPGPRYQVRVSFRAPLDFVYRWCTDYTPGDARLEGEKFERRILRRSPREVVYEDLEELDGGWFWTRHIIRLMPPNRWHSDSIGSHRAYLLDYRLTRLGADRTQLTLTARRSPYGIGGRNPPKGQWERSVKKSWKSFGRFLERDYRKARPKRARR